jgi:hypothetical protein
MSTVACIRDIITGGEVTGIATGRCMPAFPIPLANMRLPTDPLKYVNLTFDGVNANSEIRIYRNSDGSETAGVELCDANHVFSGVPYYGTGQVCTIRIVHPDYKIKEFSYTIPGVDQTIPIQQELDKWYSNPA